jgi:hypothetical protein
MPDKPHERYPNLNEKREILNHFRVNANQIGNTIIHRYTPTNPYEIFFLAGIINRSIDLVEGFNLLLEDWNLLCAIPIIRMQLDNLLRLNYLSKLENSDEIYELFKKVSSGEKFDKIKDNEGKNLNELRLRDYARKEFPWVDDIYKNTSKYVHFSDRHIFAPIIYLDEKNRMVYHAIGNKSTNAKEKDLASLYEVMIKISQCILGKLDKVKW